jgi:hypothetical protein
MKQLLLAIALIIVPVAVFAGFNLYWSHPKVSSAKLGDLTPLKTIISDVRAIAASGDLAAAETRITDFEIAWDDGASTMRPLNTDAWTNIDEAADAALGALRDGKPNAGHVASTLTALMSELNDPSLAPGGAGTAVPAPVAMNGVTITDQNGRLLPCEEMLATLRNAMTVAELSDIDKTNAESYQAKALERCNADDDQHADEFSAQALALLTR